MKVTSGDTADDPSRATVDSYGLPTVVQKPLPVTVAGCALAGLGILPATLNGLMRGLLAKYYQVAAMAGLFLLVWGNRRRRRIPASQREYLCLAAASFVGLAADVLLPDLSVEYGLLRAFEQALIFLGATGGRDHPRPGVAGVRAPRRSGGRRRRARRPGQPERGHPPGHGGAMHRS